MSKILKREEITEGILEIINSAKKELVIVSPYVKLTPKLIEAFDNKKNKLLISLIFREKLTQKVFDFFDNMPNVIMYSNIHLHTKCYLNEQNVILTSMNLYEYSIKTNFELGVLLRYKGTDKRSYFEVKDEIEYIQSRSHCLTEYKIRAYKNQGKTVFCTSCSIPIFPKNPVPASKSPDTFDKSWVCTDCNVKLKKLEKKEDQSEFLKEFGNFCFNCGTPEDFNIPRFLMPICMSCMKKDTSPVEDLTW